MDSFFSGYLIFALVFTLIYFFFFLLPYFWSRGGVAGWAEDLVRFKNYLRNDINRVTEEDAETLTVEDTDNLSEETREVIPTVIRERAKRAKRMERPQSFTKSYSHPLVQETVAYFAARYPSGDFRTFDLERMPSYVAYMERLLAARNFAGLFVLVGLLGTLIKLGSVVTLIGSFTNSESMQASEFLAEMGGILSGTGDAFLASVVGLLAMLVILTLIGMIDRSVQKGILRYDREVQAHVATGLVEHMEATNPNLSINDLIAETGAMMGRLNETVGTLTRELNGSLAGFAERIREMLTQFGTFREQYARLGDLLNSLNAAARQMSKFTEGVDRTVRDLERAGQRMANPIEEFNRSLNTVLREKLAILADSIDANRGVQEVGIQRLDEIQRLTQEKATHLDTLFARFLSDYKSSHDELNTAIKALTVNLQGSTDTRLKEMEKTVQEAAGGVNQLFEEFLETYNKYQRELIEKTERTDGKRLSALVEKMSADYGNMLRRMDDQTQQLERLSARMRAEESVTLFGWLRSKLGGRNQQAK